MTTTIRFRRAALCAAALLPALAGAQQANPSVRAFGMGNNYTAASKGYETIAWNPAMLAMANQPGFSLGGFIVGASGGVGPITINDLADYSGTTIPKSVRQGWVNTLRADGPQTGNIDGGMTILALSWGKFAASVSASGTGAMNLNADAMETIFLGNADAVAANRTLRPSGSFSASGFVTTALSWSKATSWKPTGKKDESFAFGLTGKYVMGMANVSAEDAGSMISKDTLKLRFPVLLSTGSAGSGMGMDLGAAWHGGNTTLGLTVTNVFNSFGWDAGNIECSDISATIDANTTNTNTDEVACSSSATLRSRTAAVEEQKFAPGIRAGFAWDGKKNWTVTADVQSQFGDEATTILVGPKTSIGVGAEFRGIGFLPLRAGFAAITGGTAIAGGAGLRLGHYEMNVAMQMRKQDGVSSTNVMFGLLSFR
ncbi:MAG: conjugal transfer protein TraF [Gemmatimonadaceae bacterium]|nr:conjugal transfer protein TraF [Gemmatimonadaceae bacterium]